MGGIYHNKDWLNVLLQLYIKGLSGTCISVSLLVRQSCIIEEEIVVEGYI